MKKIISILACVCLLLSAMVIPVSAAETTATITFDDSSKATWSTTQQIWQENGITVTNNKGSGNNIDTSNKYCNPARFYKGSEVIVEYPGMTKLVIDHTGVGSKYYGWANSFSDSNATVEEDADIATITFATPVDSFTFNSLSIQCRVHSMTVYAAEAGEDVCVHEDRVYESNGDETHTVVCDSCGETISTANCKDIDLDGACDTCEGDVALPETLTIAEAIALGAEQATDAYTTDKYLVTGQITAIADTKYGNMHISDEEGNDIYIYGMYSADGSVRYEALESKPDEGDTVTVLSVVGNYKGTPQLKDVWLIEFTAGELEPTEPDPEADTALTIEEAIALGESKKSNVYTEGKYYVTGTITEVYKEDYGNMYIADENGNTLTIYGSYSADGTVDYKDMEIKPVAGDTIKVYGIIGNYNGAAQMKNAWIIEIVAEEEEVFEGTDPENPIQLAVAQGAPVIPVEIKVPAEGTVFVQAADANGIFHVTSATGSYRLINGMANQATAEAEYDLVLCGYEMVNIYNPGEETITLYVFLEAGAGEVVGTWDNPEVLELQENPEMPNFPPRAQAQTELAAGNQGYFYVITATAEGNFAINVSAFDAEYNDLGYQFNVTNNTTGVQYDRVEVAAGVDNYYDPVMIPVKAGDELLINAGTFDAADMWNAPAGTINVLIGFSAAPTIGSQEAPEVIEALGDYAATVEAGSQGYYYEWTAEKDGTATITMKDASWTYVVNNLTSYAYGDIQWSDSDPVLSTYEVEVKAGDLLSILVNTYDAANEFNAPAGTVNWTLGFTEKVVDAKFSIADADAYIGKEFQVAIDISNNPGIYSAKLDIAYDKDVLELKGAEAGDFINGSEVVDDVTLIGYNFGPIDADTFVINWVNGLATENTTADGVFAILTFRVKDGVAVGETEISIAVDEDNTFDKDFNNVAFATESATITIKDGMPGDVNGDGKVDNKDYALLMQHLNGWNVEIDLGVADVNGDGKVDNKDYALLMQYLNGWDVELK